MDLIQKTREFLIKENIDYLLVNACNEFLMEYTPLEENARFALTGFSGSTGDALISKDKISLFVDGRYHQQADQEVDKSIVNVVKLKIGESPTEAMKKEIKKNKTLGIVSKKISQGRVEIIQSSLQGKNAKIKLLDYDPILKENGAKEKDIQKYELIPPSITGLTSDEKFAKISAMINQNEAFLISDLEEISYLTNLRDFSQNYSSKIKAKCIVEKGFITIFSNGKIESFFSTFKTLPLNEFANYVEKKLNVEKIYADKLSLSAYDFSILKNKFTDNLGFFEQNPIKAMKSVKTKEEIEHYKSCFERTDKAIMATRDFIMQNDNISEYDIEKELEKNFYKFGAKSLSFKSIVAKDKNSALAHYSKNSKDEILKKRSLVLVDCGAYYEGGYATDCTRVFVKGSPSELHKKIYTIVLKGFLKAFNKKINQKITGFSLDKAARTLINELAPKNFVFSHSLGHGIGISVHENPPTLTSSTIAKTQIKPNMCFTIEPGLYNPKHFGVRLENSCYLEENENGLEIKSFTNVCYEKALIDFSMLSATEKKWLKKFELR